MDLWEDSGQVVLASEHDKDGTDDPSSLRVFSLIYPVGRMGFYSSGLHSLIWYL